nr:DUF2268 domain-containing putative Zn-dependent protease [Radiobacillus kanasensis]
MFKAVKESIQESSDMLPGEGKPIIITPTNPSIPSVTYSMERMNGVLGFSPNDGSILLIIDSTYEKESLLYTVAHEYHHTVNKELNQNGYISSFLIDRILFEAKADAFAEMVYPNIEVPWTKPLTKEEEKKILYILNNNYDSTNKSLIDEFRNGSPDKGLPIWSNYRIGNKIMHSFLAKNPDVSIKEWTEMPAKEIIQNSDYKDILRRE